MDFVHTVVRDSFIKWTVRINITPFFFSYSGIYLKTFAANTICRENIAVVVSMPNDCGL